MKKLFVLFSAGCLGALANSIAVWLFGSLGITGSLGVSIAPALTPNFLYPRIVWGGLWGFLFLIPILKSKFIKKGTLMSIFPTLVQLFIIFPYKADKGMAGLDLGLLTPLFVLFYNWIWGVVTSIAIKYSK